MCEPLGGSLWWNWIAAHQQTKIARVLKITVVLVISFSVECRKDKFSSVINVPHVLHIAVTVIKLSIKNKHNKFFIMLKRNSVKISLQTW